MACGLLATAAAVDGSAALLVLAAWVLVLALVGLRLTATGSDRQLRHPELVLASLDGDGGIGEPQVIRLVASQAALDAVRRRPRG